MRIFKTFEESHGEIRRDLYEVGVWIHGATVQDQDVEGDPKYDFMELSPYVYTITDPLSFHRYADLLRLNMPWLLAEFRERLQGGHNPGTAWRLRRDTWEPFIELGGKFAYTYSIRMGTRMQIRKVVEELRIHPASRQCIVAVWNPVIDIGSLGGKHRVPCSMFYHLMVRDGKVNLHYVMRSCDFFLHFPYDQCLAVMLQVYVANQLELRVGTFSHLITSLHAFRKDFPEGVF